MTLEILWNANNCFFELSICTQEAKVQEEKLEQWMACVPEYESFWAFSTAKKGYSGTTPAVIITFFSHSVMYYMTQSTTLSRRENNEIMNSLRGSPRATRGLWS